MIKKLPPKSRKALDVSHACLLAKTRSLTEQMLEVFEKDCAITAEGQPSEAMQHWWGAKESRVATLGKLVALVLKLVPVEREVLETISSDRAKQRHVSPTTVRWTSEELILLTRFVEYQQRKLEKPQPK